MNPTSLKRDKMSCAKNDHDDDHRYDHQRKDRQTSERMNEWTNEPASDRWTVNQVGLIERQNTVIWLLQALSKAASFRSTRPVHPSIHYWLFQTTNIPSTLFRSEPDARFVQNRWVVGVGVEETRKTHQTAELSSVWDDDLHLVVKTLGAPPPPPISEILATSLVWNPWSRQNRMQEFKILFGMLDLVWFVASRGQARQVQSVFSDFHKSILFCFCANLMFSVWFKIYMHSMDCKVTLTMRLRLKRLIKIGVGGIVGWISFR